MKKIITSNVLDPLQLQPFTAQSLRFIQESKEDDAAAIIKTIVISNLGSYSLTIPYVISGCVLTGAGEVVTAGEIFYGGKYYQTAAASGTTNVARYFLTTSQDVTADPLTFSNSSVFNVHNIYTYVPQDVITGGHFDASQFVSIYPSVVNKLSFNSAPTNQSTTSTSYIDLTSALYTTPNDGITRTWLILFNGVSKVSTSAGDGTRVQFYNNNTLTQIATTRTYLDIVSSTIDLMELNLSLQKVISLPPNTVVKVRFLSISGGGISLEDNNFSIIEI